MSIISVIQYKPRMGFCAADVADNFRRCEDLVQTAWSVGSELIVFPELCLTGYSFISGEAAISVSESWDGKTFKSMRGVATTLKSYVAWGYVESDGSRLYNSATIVSPDGSVVCRYRKLNLWGNDFLWASPGTDPPRVVSTDIGLMSLAICRDIRNVVPALVPRRASDDQGDSGGPLYGRERPEIVAACVNWGDGGFPPVKLMDFVASNRCTLAVANRWGVEESSHGFSQDFGLGGSVIIEPDWKVHTSGLEFGKDCVVTARVEIGRKS